MEVLFKVISKDFESKSMTRDKVSVVSEKFLSCWKSSSRHDQQIMKNAFQSTVQHLMVRTRGQTHFALAGWSQCVIWLLSDFSKIDPCDEGFSLSLSICDIMEEVLWKNLKSRKDETRRNAAHVFFSIFPMHDPRQNRSSTEAHFKRLFETVLELLSDKSHFVRFAAIRHFFKALQQWWDIIPSYYTEKYFEKLLEFYAYDKSAQVREQMYRSIKDIISPEMNEELLQDLRAFLSKVTNHIHDVKSTVRLAFMEMLLEIRNKDLFSFWDVVPAHHLVARLTEEDGATARALVDLLFPSFCPLEEAKEDISVLLTRLLTLMLMNRDALRKLFFHSEDVLSTDDAVGLMLRLLQAILDSLAQIQERKSQNRGTANAVEPTGIITGQIALIRAARAMSASEPRAADALLDVIGVLWFTRRDSLSADQERRLTERLQCAATPLLRAFMDTTAFSSLVVVMGFAPPRLAAVRPLVQRCKTLSATPNQRDDKLLESLNFLMMQDQAQFVLDLLLAGILRDSVRRSRRSSSKRKAQQATISLEHDVAITQLSRLLVAPHLRPKFQMRHLVMICTKLEMSHQGTPEHGILMYARKLRDAREK